LLTERKTQLLFLLESLALGTFAWQWIFFYGKRLSQRSLPFIFSSLLLVLFLSIFVLYGAFILYSRWLASFPFQSREQSSRTASKILLPLLFLPLDLIRNFIYLRESRLALLVASALGVLWLHFSHLEKIKRTVTTEKIPEEESPRILAGLVFLLTLLIYTLYSSGLIFPPQPLTGDEPHYLVLAQSLVKDGDINVRNNYENEGYTFFYPGPLDSHRRPGKKGNAFHYSRHTPALPILLAPFYWLGEKMAGARREIFITLVRFPMSLMAAFLSLFVFLSARRLTGRIKPSLVIWSIFSFLPPLLFYSHLIYPEIPAALILIIIFYFVISREETRPWRQILASAGIGFLPWLGIKYAALTAVVFIVLFFNWWNKEKRKGINLVALTAPLTLSGIAYFAFLWSLYGSLSPFALYKGTTANVDYDMTSFFHFRILEFFRCGVGYLFDQRAGLIVYAPITLFIFGGLYLAFKSRKRVYRSSLLIFFSYWAFCSLGYYWGGYCPPGRTLLPVFWIAALFMAHSFSRKEEEIVLVKRGLGALTILMTVLLLQNPTLLYHDNLGNPYSDQGIQSNLLSSLSNSFIDFHKWAPSLSHEEKLYWPTLVVWILAAAALTGALIIHRRRRTDISPQGSLNKQVVRIFFLGTFVVGYVFFNVQLGESRTAEQGNLLMHFQDENTYGEEEKGFWIKGESGSRIIVSSLRPANAISIHSSSPSTRKTSIRVGPMKSGFVYQNKGEETSLFASPVGFRWKGRYLYTVQIREKGGFYPYRMDRRIQDNRFLGVFIRIELTEKGNSQLREPIDRP